ncbi:hypothetical protein N1027_18755 [Herbiconiux sp. CPCC 205763]|uniref:Asp23/Gls24 family envelope stress response protein n=1 Tax=Herbiconiux aconitum TaxID=2970913 RepID=A0ABT2GVD4_9MICO|nr:hypothetical protein [Herbiconiux aconitum]MCS5720177.1 hypothetical protein [Herbiconiux aconitum]
MTALSLPDELVRVVSGVPGVITVYPAKAALPSLIENTVAAATGKDAPAPIALDDRNGRLTIDVTIGITDGASAAQTCRQVYEAVAAHLSAHTVQASRIRVLVANIETAAR